MQVKAISICDACGKAIVIPLDFTQGVTQEYIEKRPVGIRSKA